MLMTVGFLARADERPELMGDWTCTRGKFMAGSLSIAASGTNGFELGREALDPLLQPALVGAIDCDRQNVINTYCGHGEVTSVMDFDGVYTSLNLRGVGPRQLKVSYHRYIRFLWFWVPDNNFELDCSK